MTRCTGKRIRLGILLLLLMSMMLGAWAEGEWTCAGCGAANGSAFCGNCGMSRETSAEIVICPGCGAQSAASEGHRFCAACGTELPQSVPAALVCASCGVQAESPEARFCGNCGADLTAEVAQPAAPEAVSKPTPVPAPELPLRPTSELYSWYGEETRYYYHQLSDDEKKLFSLLYDGFVNFQPRIEIPAGYTVEMYNRAWVALRWDCPELMQIGSGMYYSDGGQMIAAEPQYILSAEEFWSRWETVKGIVAGMPSLPGFGETAYSKQLTIYRYVIEHADYLLNEPYTTNADAVYINGQAQCCGYSRALNLAWRYYGIPCFEIGGTAYSSSQPDGYSHSWSMVQMDGNWYHCDALTDDVDWSSVDPNFYSFPENGNFYLRYFNLPDSLMLRRHVPDTGYFTYPAAVSADANYSMRDGIFVSAAEQDVFGYVTGQMIARRDQGLKNVMILFESADHYAMCKANMRESVINPMNDGGGYNWWSEDSNQNIYVFVP